MIDSDTLFWPFQISLSETNYSQISSVPTLKGTGNRKRLGHDLVVPKYSAPHFSTLRPWWSHWKRGSNCLLFLWRLFQTRCWHRNRMFCIYASIQLSPKICNGKKLPANIELVVSESYFHLKEMKWKLLFNFCSPRNFGNPFSTFFENFNRIFLNLSRL